MVAFKKLALLLAAALPFGSASPVPQSPQPQIKGNYIITLKSGLSTRDVDAHMSWIDNVHKRSIGARDLDLPGVKDTYQAGSFKGYSGSFDDATIEALRNNPEVADVEEDQIYYVTATVEQSDATYGLAALSNRNSGSTTYSYDDTAGADTFSYVVDSGINVDHVDFEGRATRGFNAAGGDDIDTIGHGTHVAGTIGSKTYGVAKKTNLISVKVFIGRTSSTTIIMRGYQWALDDIKAKGRQARSVINMSLGGPPSAAFNNLVEQAFGDGVLSVVAAGNEAQPTSNVSPASAANALTVGGIDVNWAQYTNSNFGPEVDIMAPAVSVLSLNIGTTTGTTRKTGTSMAAPHVAGLAVYLAALENINTPAELTARIKALGTVNKATGLSTGNPNLIAFNGISE